MTQMVESGGRDEQFRYSLGLIAVQPVCDAATLDGIPKETSAQPLPVLGLGQCGKFLVDKRREVGRVEVESDSLSFDPIPMQKSSLGLRMGEELRHTYALFFGIIKS